MSTLYKLTHLGKSYKEGDKDRRVLNDINASFGRRKFIVIQGRSGSGKSTLLNLLGGLDLPDTGDVRLDDQIINHMTERQRTLFRRHHIGFVFQTFNLIPTLTVFENLAFPLELNGINGRAAGEQVTAILEKFSLADRMRSFPEHLSGGEQQRIAIARAIIHAPKAVLADEPTGNLDLSTERQVLELLRQLPDEHDVTIICATHSPEIAAAADEIFHLDQELFKN